MSWQLDNSSRWHRAKKKKKEPVDDQQVLVSTSSRETKSLIVAPSTKQTLEFSKRWILATASLSLAVVIVVFSTTDELSVRFGTTRAAASDGSNIICSTTNYIVSTAANHTARTTTVTSFLRESSGDEEQQEERQTVYSASSTNLTKPTTTPKVAWLMSFPNSGTSYTLDQIRSVSRTTTATNYGHGGKFQNQPSIPIHAGAEKDGPFLQLTTQNTTIPSKYILTKTHCAGFCSDCTPDGYVETPRSFQMLCQSGRKYVPLDDEGNSNNLDLIEVTYDADLVGKAVHVIRNPLDNIVARYHLMWNRHNKSGDERWTSKHPNDVTGFKRWCHEFDKRSELPNMRWVDERLKALFKKIPCHEEFFRYVQWHNLAFSLTRDLGIPSLIINYQDYRDDLDGTTDRLLNFLELERKGPNLPFVHGKEYKDYYTPEERKGIEAFVMEYATDDTWQNVRGHEFLS